MGALLGIADYVIPSSVITKKQSSFEKICNVTTTESTRRMLFGNIVSNNQIKLEVSSTIQYFDKLPTLKQSHSLPRTELKKMELSPKNKSLGLTEHLSQNKLSREKSPYLGGKKKATAGIKKRPLNAKPSATPNYKPNTTNNIHPTGRARRTKNDTLSIQSIQSIENQSSLQNTSNMNTVKCKEESEEKDTSFIDEILTKEISPQSLSSDISDYIDMNPIEQIGLIKDPNQLQIKTKDLINMIFNYQTEYYEKYKQEIELRSALREVLIKNNEKYRIILKKRNRLNEQFETSSMKKEIVINVNRKEDNEIKKILPLKNCELEMYKKIFDLRYNKKEIDDSLKNQMKKFEEESIDIMVRLLKGVIAKYGSIKYEFTRPEEVELYDEVANKFALPKEAPNYSTGNHNIKEIIEEESEEKEHKSAPQFLEYVIASNQDENDVKLSKFLTEYYSRKKVTKVPFKKISNGFYEYGPQKVIVKFESDGIKVKYHTMYITLEKFIDSTNNSSSTTLSKGSKSKGKMKTFKK